MYPSMNYSRCFKLKEGGLYITSRGTVSIHWSLSNSKKKKVVNINKSSLLTLCRRSSADLQALLNSVVRTALRKPSFNPPGWRAVGGGALGQYLAPEEELLLDVQGAEVLWRNDGLRPVPDSMTQMGDYEVSTRKLKAKIF